MCGVPVHSAEGYLARLIKGGCRVAIAEQTETPEQAKERARREGTPVSKSLVARDIVRLVTAGTLTEEALLEPRRANLLVAIAPVRDGVGLASCDISTGRMELEECPAEALDAALAELRFDAAANTIYHFVWDRFCDWYLELIKGQIDEETKAVAGWTLDQIFVMLHPFMPFITEELWSKQGERANHPLITASWVDPQAEVDPTAKAEIDWLIALTGAVRTAKNELGIAPGAKLEAFCPAPGELAKSVVEANGAAIERLARLTPIHMADAPAGAAMQIAAGEDAFVIPLEGVIDIASEKARLSKALEASTKEAKSLEGRLSNANFVDRAKPEAVDKARADHAHHSAEIERLTAALARLG